MRGAQYVLPSDVKTSQWWFVWHFHNTKGPVACSLCKLQTCISANVTFLSEYFSRFGGLKKRTSKSFGVIFEKIYSDILTYIETYMRYMYCKNDFTCYIITKYAWITENKIIFGEMPFINKFDLSIILQLISHTLLLVLIKRRFFILHAIGEQKIGPPISFRGIFKGKRVAFVYI